MVEEKLSPVAKRFFELTQGINFQRDDVYKQIEALPPEKQERIKDLMGIVLADIFHPLALKKHGNILDNSIRDVILTDLEEPEIAEYLSRSILEAREKLAALGLTAEQMKAVLAMFTLLPEILTEIIIELIQPWHLIPRTRARQIVDILVQMIKEDPDVNAS